MVYDVGKNFENQYSQMPWIALKLSTMVGKIFENQYSHMPRIALKLSTMVGEKFENQENARYLFLRIIVKKQ